MAEPGTWDSIKQHGLLSTQALLDHCKASASQREVILSRHRPKPVQVGGFWIRDQKPMNHNLAKCLTEGTTARQWFELLNSKVFFWTCPKRLAVFRMAYGFKPQLIIEVSTEKLLAHHAQSVTLCHINSGATRMPNHYRNPNSFQSIEDFPYSSDWKPAELTVQGEVSNIVELVSRVYEVGEANEETILFKRTR